jgi:hypothetical protein
MLGLQYSPVTKRPPVLPDPELPLVFLIAFGKSGIWITL